MQKIDEKQNIRILNEDRISSNFTRPYEALLGPEAKGSLLTFVRRPYLKAPAELCCFLPHRENDKYPLF
jgi:hypothetical protein